MNNEPVKFCKDCKHYEPRPGFPVPLARDHCVRVAAKVVDVTTGEKYLTGTLDPRRERHSDAGCGPSARYFEKRSTFWGRVFKR